MPQFSLCLHHELVLLLLDDAKGSFQGSMYQYGLAGALLSELMLQGLIKLSPDEKKIVNVIDTNPTGDPLLDDAVKLMADSNKPHPLTHWVSRVAQLPELCLRVAKQLCDLEVLSYSESKILWLFTQRRFPEMDGSFENAIRSRMADVMFNNDQKADERTSVLIALANSCGALAANFAPVQLGKNQDRIKEICEGKQLASGATVEAIAAVQACMTAIQIATTTAATTAAISAANN